MSYRTLLLSIRFAFLALLMGGLAAPTASGQSKSKKSPQQRSFVLSYGFKVKDLPQDAKLQVWFPVPSSDRWQTVSEDPEQWKKWGISISKDDAYGNRIGYIEKAAPKTFSQMIQYQVIRKEATQEVAKTKLTDKMREAFLKKNSLVPIDGRPVELLGTQKLPSDPIRLARKLYDIVLAHMKYDKSIKGYGEGDVMRACEVGAGNCTDFHSLFISLARHKRLPARFEIGFPLPEKSADGKTQNGKIKGYHCWAWFWSPQHGWVGVDISEADKDPSKTEYFFGNLTEDRIAFSTGRDIKLVPNSKSGPLNYFVYPHVEVDGKVWPKEKIELDVRFQDAK